MVGVAQLVRAPDCGSGGRRFDSDHPPHYAPVAQSAEHLPFKQGVRGSNPRWSTKGKSRPLVGRLLPFPLNRGDSKGTGVNDMPVACQSRAPARPEAGESPLEHTKIPAIRRVFFGAVDSDSRRAPPPRAPPVAFSTWNKICNEAALVGADDEMKPLR